MKNAELVLCPECKGSGMAWTDFGKRDRVYEICHTCWGSGREIKRQEPADE